MPLLSVSALMCVLCVLPFRASADAAASTSLTGVGSTLPITLYQSAMFSYRFVDPAVQTAFYGCTNDQALCRLTNASRECAATDTAAVPAAVDWVSLATLPSADLYQRYPDLQLFPTVASAVVLIYNLNGVTDLVLSMAILAKIWSGRITTWDHPEIQATNPNFSAWNIPKNKSITLIARADSAGTTQVLKRALAGVDAAFKAQVGTASAATWAGVQVVWASGSQLVTSAVMRGRYTLGYVPMGFALANRVPVAKLNRTGVVVEPSAASVQYALLERGLAFGNNGDDPAHLTGDLINAVNPLAWPITSYSYVGVRKSTLRPGATCATTTALVNFWMWFWNSNDASSLTASLGFSVLPAVVRDYVVARFSQGMTCNGQLVWQAPAVQAVVGYGPESAAPIFAKFQQAYALVDSSTALNYSTLPSSDSLDVAPLLRTGAFVVSTTPLPSSNNVANFVLACEALVAVSQYTLTLDGPTLAKILNGDIQTWLHPDILALNPNGLRDSGGRALNDTAQRIVLLQGPTAGSAALTALLRRYHPNYAGTAILAAEAFSDEVQLQSSVLGTPYSFSVTALAGSLPVELQLAVMDPDGTGTLPPVQASAQSCSSYAVYDPNSRSVSFANYNGSCYPLILTLYLGMQRQCLGTSVVNTFGFTFMQWMFSGTALDAALSSLGLASFTGVSTAIQAANDEAMFQLSCQVRPAPATATSILPLLLGIIIPIVAVVLLGGGGCGWWLWRVTEHNRRMRKKFSNDNVAESCAEAIARFDLAAVAWLQEVKEPNKIQLAFLAIIGLLTEVKPFIPDQLMVRLTTSQASPRDAEEEGSDADKLSQMSSPRALLGPDKSRSHFAQRPLEQPHNSKTRRGTQRSLASSEGGKQVVAMKDWARRRCTFLCVRFGSVSPNAERRLPALAQAVGRIVDLAKANGATIDAVGVDFVTVHWGVTSNAGASSTRAVHVGLEVAKLRGTLPEDQRAAFWVQVGVGRGLCDCGTVSTESGHRYFVVWGAEASLAVEITMTNLPKRVRTVLLVTPAVYQEVQFTVQCAPRLWTHGDLLLWEPLCALKKDDDDEWMYELKKMNDGAMQCNKALLDVFLMAKSDTGTADLAARVAELRAQHEAQMSEADVAALDLLLAMPAAKRQGSWTIDFDDIASNA